MKTIQSRSFSLNLWFNSVKSLNNSNFTIYRRSIHKLKSFKIFQNTRRLMYLLRNQTNKNKSHSRQISFSRHLRQLNKKNILSLKLKNKLPLLIIMCLDRKVTLRLKCHNLNLRMSAMWSRSFRKNGTERLNVWIQSESTKTRSYHLILVTVSLLIDFKINFRYSNNYILESLVQSGHAEIEANKILYIYGNALEVLQRSEFYD